MIVTKKAIPRRTMLRGLGAVDGVAAARRHGAGVHRARADGRRGRSSASASSTCPTASSSTSGRRPSRAPASSSRRSSSRSSRSAIVCWSCRGLTQNATGETSKSGAVHGRCATKFLTGAIPRPFGQEGNEFHAAVSLDQVIASELGRETQLGVARVVAGVGRCRRRHMRRRIQLHLRAHDHAGAVRPRRCTMEHNPRVVFERMFGDGGSTDIAVAAGADGSAIAASSTR